MHGMLEIWSCLFTASRRTSPNTSPWLFHTWGMDILGPFPLVKGQVKSLIVVIDYFIKKLNRLQPSLPIECKIFFGTM